MSTATATAVPIETPKAPRWRGMAIVGMFAVAFTWLVMQQDLWDRVLGAMFPTERAATYSVPLATLTMQHLTIVLVSSGLTILVGIPLGIWVTRASGKDFRDIVAAGVDIGQTFPPVAVLALMMPILGFGLWPAVVALFLYGLCNGLDIDQAWHPITHAGLACAFDHSATCLVGVTG